jgi:hypothetical protein
MKAIDILRWIDAIEDGGSIKVSRQRELNQDPIDLIPSVQVIDHSLKLALGRSDLEVDLLVVQPETGSTLGLPPHIDRTRRVIPHPHHSNTWRTGQDLNATPQ